jgi:hypothetical protein
MNGVIEIKIPEIEGLEEIFAEKTTGCEPGGPSH